MNLKTPAPQPGKEIAGNLAFKGKAFSVRIASVRKSSGATTTREIVEHSNSVAVVALDADSNCILVRQAREAPGKTLLEIPAGGIDPGETPDDCVRRELQEEIGHLPHKIQRIGGFYSAPGFCTEFLHLYLATELEPHALHAPDTDEITIVRVAFRDTPKLIANGEIQDAKSIAGLLTVLTFYQEVLALSRDGLSSPGLTP